MNKKTALILIFASIFSFLFGRFSTTYEIHITRRSAETQTILKGFPKDVKEVDTQPTTKPTQGDKVNVDFSLTNSPYQGKEDAPITFVEFSDFQCPFCKNSQDVIKRIMSYYEGKVKRIFKNNPLPFHQDSMLAHQAAMAASKQGKFWDMMQIIFENQQNIKEENLLQYAKEIGLNMKKFEQDWKSKEVKDIIQRDMDDAKKAGVNATPTFFINNQMIVGAEPFDKFDSIIKKELSK